jgi:phosphoribosylformylglycinamidine cyclo-ligase
MGMNYKQAGVDIDQGDALVDRIKPLARKTNRKEVISGVGGFGGLFALPPGAYREPVLVSGTDGVGTKLKIAFELNQHRSIGIDLVAMSVNDILTCGAEPLFFLDYFATSKLDVDQAEQVVAGIAEGCEQSRCALLGGETAELPGFYAKGEYDLAGFCVGVVERSEIIDGKSIEAGDAIIGLASSGFHSNGFSLVRLVLNENNVPLTEPHPQFPHHSSLGAALLTPTRIYVQDILALKKALPIKGMAHITGSGIVGNLTRCFPDFTQAVIQGDSWPRADVFKFIQSKGQISDRDMLNTFNCGIGFAVIVGESQASATLQLLKDRGVSAWNIGRVENQPALAEPLVVVK